MAIQVSDYSISGFNSVPDFADALKKFDEISGGDLVRKQIRDLFRKHQMQKRFGLALLHKHWLLSGDERATEIRGTSNPIPGDMNLAATPASWAFDPRFDNLHPVEFALPAQHVDWDDQSIQAFLVAFRACLTETGSQELFGLCLYPGDDYPGRVEFSVGRSNVNLHPQEAQHLPPSELREAAWYFSDELEAAGCRCNCFTTGGHNHSHGQTI